MTTDEWIVDVAQSLGQRGWSVKKSASPSLPTLWGGRYPWLPQELVRFLCSFDELVSPDQKAWFNTHMELVGATTSVFAWNQWELDSITAAVGDSAWENAIRKFWAIHFPVVMSVKSGYAYFAVRPDNRIVMGMEPEFEETTEVASDIRQFVSLIVNGQYEQIL